jgi:hypothetical protein
MLRKIDPQLETSIGFSIRTREGLFRMHDASPSSHKLQVTSMENASISSKVLVLHNTFQDIGYSFLSSVGMIGEASTGTSIQIIKHEERREVALLKATDGAPNSGPCALGLFESGENLVDRSELRHG